MLPPSLRPDDFHGKGKVAVSDDFNMTDVITSVQLSISFGVTHNDFQHRIADVCCIAFTSQHYCFKPDYTEHQSNTLQNARVKLELFLKHNLFTQKWAQNRFRLNTKRAGYVYITWTVVVAQCLLLACR